MTNRLTTRKTNAIGNIAAFAKYPRLGKRDRTWHYVLLGAALASFAFLTRSIAFALIVAAFVYLLKERLWRPALIFAVGVFCLWDHG